MGSERLHQSFISTSPAHTFFHGHSFTANPLGCAAALASLDLLQSNPPRYQDFESRHRPLLETLSKRAEVQRPRSQGTMAAFDLAIGEASYLNPVGKQLQRLCLNQGVYLRPLGDVVYLLPPLCINDQQLEECYGAISTALEDLS
jgi:adenosylmethionine-8-amino-7-oxononanoate aminotransferase